MLRLPVSLGADSAADPGQPAAAWSLFQGRRSRPALARRWPGTPYFLGALRFGSVGSNRKPKPPAELPPVAFFSLKRDH